MAYYDGETLAEKVDRGPLPIDEACDYARQVARALAAAHARGIIHRDIKPSNVIVTSEGIAKVLDFGLAKMADVSLTPIGTTLGTVGYMSPEQVRGDALDHRTDLWSLGVLLYEMMAGLRPFHRHRPALEIRAILHDEPDALAVLRPEVPADLEAAVLRLLAKQPAERFSSSEDLESSLSPE